MVPVDLRDLVGWAADLYRATGNSRAAEAARLMRAAAPEKPADPPLDHDEFGSNRPKLMNVIDSLGLARDSREKPVSTFSHPALALPVLRYLPRHELAGLPWTDGGFALPASIKGRNAYAELIGPEGPVVSDKCRFGFYLQAPDCLYPPHSHAAEELYLLLGGSAEWQLDDGKPFVPPDSGLVHHLPWQKHAMRTGASPLLALWVWLGDIRYGTYSI